MQLTGETFSMLQAIFSTVTIILAIGGNVVTTKVALGVMHEQVTRLTQGMDKLADEVKRLSVEVAVLDSRTQRA